MFHDPEQEHLPPRFYKKTFYTPSLGRDVTVDAYCGVIQTQATNHEGIRKPKDNITSRQRKALTERRQMVPNSVIRIGSADKGRPIVVQDTEKYLQEVTRLLRLLPTFEQRPYSENHQGVQQDHQKAAE